ncbi:MAG: DUF2971 domain-containing protein [Candidatus Omnitrophica bacterium]|nr:DUF2971 domain-containing protein [Candidatus Omnitrophota bacterium]
MPILYKYCDQIGALKILGSLELKLPYISDVNDPVECSPVFYCGENKTMIHDALSLCLEKGMTPRINLEEKSHVDNIQRMLEDRHRTRQEAWNSKNCLLSLSGTARNVVMWAHYAEKHRGIVIGIDFDNVFGVGQGISMDNVTYSKKRVGIDLLLKEELRRPEEFYKVLITKSDSWNYEDEYRTIILAEDLEQLRQKSKADCRDFNGKQAWFLRLTPESIQQVVFGLYTDHCLQTTVGHLVGKFPNVKLFQTMTSKDEFDFELKSMEGVS